MLLLAYLFFLKWYQSIKQCFFFFFCMSSARSYTFMSCILCVSLHRVFLLMSWLKSKTPSKQKTHCNPDFIDPIRASEFFLHCLRSNPIVSMKPRQQDVMSICCFFGCYLLHLWITTVLDEDNYGRAMEH